MSMPLRTSSNKIALALLSGSLLHDRAVGTAVGKASLDRPPSSALGIRSFTETSSGTSDGQSERKADGLPDGLRDGKSEGTLDGVSDGSRDGWSESTLTGASDGAMDGQSDGTPD
jgi:hypothetical protein